MNQNLSYLKELKRIGNLYTQKRILYIRDRHPYPYDPNIYPWQEILTPIESNVWSAIRALGMPFYPQFPVWKYHIDFADPILKIAIEVDGFRYHSKEKDNARTFELQKRGWLVYRVQGKNTVIQIEEDEEGNEIEVIPLDEFLKSICEAHYPHILF